MTDFAWTNEFRPHSILKRHLAGINTDSYYREQMKALALDLAQTQVEQIQASNSSRIKKPFIPVISSRNLSNIIRTDPVTMIGVCLVPRGRLRLNWTHEQVGVSLDLFLSYKELNSVGRREIRSDLHRDRLSHLKTEADPTVTYHMDPDPSLGRIIKYLHQLEQVETLGLQEVHFVLPDVLYARTYLENASLAELGSEETQNIQPMVQAYAAREKQVIKRIMQAFFPQLSERVKIIVSSQRGYQQGLDETSDFTATVRDYYRKIPLERRAMASYAITVGYEEIDLLAARFWMSDHTGHPSPERSRLILAHIKNFSPTSRFLLQSLTIHNQIYPETSTGLLLTTSVASLFRRTETEREMYWETERRSDDDYAALPEQSIAIGEDKEAIADKFRTRFDYEKNRSPRQSRIYWIIRELAYYLHNCYIGNDADELVSQMTTILADWEDPRRRDYELAVEIIPEIVDLLKARLWLPMQLSDRQSYE